MSSVNRVLLLLKKDITLEFRSLYAVGSILLYVVTTVFIVYKAFNTLQPQVWNSMFWVLFLFAAMNATLRSFSKISGGNTYFNYSYLNPTEFMIGKILFNLIFLMLIAGLTFLIMTLFFDHPVQDFFLFSMAVIILCSFSSAASIQGSSNATVMSVLSLPLSIPILLITLKISMQSMRLITDSSIANDYAILGGIIILMFSVTLLLFPYLWKS